MKKFFLNNWQIISLLILSGLIVWPLFLPGYFSHHDDLQVIRIFEMRKCFADLQIPCRWVNDMGFGNGYPLFNFYGPLAYYIGALASYVLGFVASAKLLFFLPLVLGGVGMYLLAKDIFGKIPGIVSAVLFLFAPYRALDSYVRGAVGESFGIAIISFVFFFFLRLIKNKNRKYLVLATFTTFLFFVSHNIMTLIFTPLILLWVIYWSHQEKWNGLKTSLMALALAFGLSAFFVLPAYLEKGLIQTEALTRYELNFRAQFVKVSQLFTDRSWNYSGSQPQSDNTISYQIGWPHWWIVAFSLVVLIFWKRRKNIQLLGGLLLVFCLAVFMTHNKSSFIWERIGILEFVQFPWRFLSIVIFASSLIGGFFISQFKGKWTTFISASIIVLAVILNWQYFKPAQFYFDVTDQSKLSGQNFIDQQAGAILDYLPKTALEPKELAPALPLVINGDAQISSFINRTNHWNFEVKVSQEATIDVPVFDFPNWTASVDGKVVEHSKSTPTGRIEIQVPVGEHTVSGQFKNTPVRTFGNLLSLASLVGILVLIKYGKNTKIYS